ncbi:pyridoxamine 5'-phosphate oxidase family protein [Spongiactinospora sp. TRM90649]|uniref:pyridoxamine 5'-phosphate oxidase family protein n=1 Tax=Spongiactinospora sp. TRM90649 TaxID=3031114 RepID=UPI0023F948C2|nr:pyridoxamine 5'-phosphate oxidase family protein [Spongiactinospora sp. TRM90649]MDF5753648.1 pyridoxamine 5'-phosphate oxidase family protein [Spongiactinospora sp. TRM90649]
MPRALTAAEREEFLAEPRIAVLSVEAEPGSGRPPLTVPVWYAYYPTNDVFTFFTGTQGRTARKAHLLEQAGRLSLCVQQPEPVYRYVTAECTVTSADREPSFDEVFAITSRYLPKDIAHAMAEAEAEAETATRGGTFVLFTVAPTHWTTFDFTGE